MQDQCIILCKLHKEHNDEIIGGEQNPRINSIDFKAVDVRNRTILPKLVKKQKNKNRWSSRITTRVTVIEEEISSGALNAKISYQSLIIVS